MKPVPMPEPVRISTVLAMEFSTISASGNAGGTTGTTGAETAEHGMDVDVSSPPILDSNKIARIPMAANAVAPAALDLFAPT